MGGELTQFVTDRLTAVELEAYQKHRGKPNIAPSTAANFFALFLEGYSLEQIVEKFPVWGLGALVDARIRYDWDVKRTEYIEDLNSQVKSRLSKLKAESLNFLTDMATVAHKEFRDEMLKYIQNPIEGNLPKNRIRSLKEYRELVGAIESLTKIEQPPVQAPQINVAPGGTANVQINHGPSRGPERERKAAILAKLANETDVRNPDEV